MSKKHFIALADVCIAEKFSSKQINLLADFCKTQNEIFDCNKFLSYIQEKKKMKCTA